MLQGGTDPIQGLVVVVRIVVEGHQLLGAGRLAQADTLLPGLVPPAVEALELLVGVGGVVDYDVSTGDQIQNGPVRIAWHMLGVGDVAGRPAGVVDPIGHGTAGVV